MSSKFSRNNEVRMKRHIKKLYEQRGSGASDYSGSFHAWTADNSQLSNYSLQNINNSPLFHPFSNNSFATPTTGIVPTGQAYMNNLAGGSKCNTCR